MERMVYWFNLMLAYILSCLIMTMKLIILAKWTLQEYYLS
jgi:hypothetical protein